MVVMFLIFLIQKSTRFLTCILLSILVSFNCLIHVNYTLLLKLWPGNWKCGSAWSEFCLCTSFQWLFSLKLKVVSDLPAYCLLQYIHSIRYIRCLLLQLSLLYIFKVLVDSLVYGRSCLTWSCRASKNHFDQSFDIVVSFLLLTIVFLPIISCRYLFRLKAVVGGFVKTSLKSLFTFNKSQCLFTAFFMPRKIRLYLSISEI